MENNGQPAVVIHGQVRLADLRLSESGQCERLPPAIASTTDATNHN